MNLKCEYCRNDAVQIWTGTDLFYKTGLNRVRPVLIPLCEEHRLEEDVTELIVSEISQKAEAKKLSFELLEGWTGGPLIPTEVEKGRKSIESYLNDHPEMIEKLSEILLYKKEV